VKAAGFTNDAMRQQRDGLLNLWGASSMPAAPETARLHRPIIAGGNVSAEQRPPDTRTAAAPQPEPGLPSPPTGPGVSAFVVPLHVELRLGDAQPAGPSAPSAVPSLPRVGPTAGSGGLGIESVRPDPSDPGYSKRGGYTPAFLGFLAPLPILTDKRHGAVLAFGTARETELRYHHFSVIMNARRRLAYVSAVNIDSAAPHRHQREKDRWFFDPRVPERSQAGNAYYASNPLDRGHLTRRDDAAWGYSKQEAELANDDTFHWTNCAPQHEVFNQGGLARGRGLLLWGNLEIAVSELAGGHTSKLSVFNGPIFSDTDQSYRQDFALPKAYWKVIVLSDGNTPRALAFQLSQADLISDILAERFRPPHLEAFEVYQVPIARLSEATGLDFGPLSAWDPLGVAGVSGTALREESAKPQAALRVFDEADVRLY
jgi:endonuclease G